MKEAADNKVEINDIEPDTFEKLLIFIYSGKIPEDLDYYAMDLFIAADKVYLIIQINDHNNVFNYILVWSRRIEERM